MSVYGFDDNKNKLEVLPTDRLMIRTATTKSLANGNSDTINIRYAAAGRGVPMALLSVQYRFAGSENWRSAMNANSQCEIDVVFTTETAKITAKRNYTGSSMYAFEIKLVFLKLE